MTERFRPDPTAFQQCVSLLCAKMETVAMRAGMSDVDCSHLEGSLAAMPPLVRDRVKLMLNGIEIQTEYDDPTMCFAARYLLRLAQDVWHVTPHPVTYEPHPWDTLGRVQ